MVGGMERQEWITQWASSAVEWIEDRTVLRADGSQTLESAPCFWTRLQRGSSTGGHIGVYLHRSREEALSAAANFAVDALGGSDSRVLANLLYEAGRHEELLELYERVHVSGDAILKVEWGLPVGDLSTVDGLLREVPPAAAGADRDERLDDWLHGLDDHHHHHLSRCYETEETRRSSLRNPAHGTVDLKVHGSDGDRQRPDATQSPNDSVES